jgi:hypothetical protein
MRGKKSITVIALILFEKVADLKFSFEVKAGDKVYFYMNHLRAGTFIIQPFSAGWFLKKWLFHNFGFFIDFVWDFKAGKRVVNL